MDFGQGFPGAGNYQTPERRVAAGAVQTPLPPRGAAGLGNYFGGAPAAGAGGTRGGAPNATFVPIRDLTPYTNGRWQIKARVLTKGDIRKFSNARGEGQFFKVELADQSGEISSTFFGRAVDKFYPLLQQGSVFIFSKGNIKAANQRFDRGDHVINFEEHASIDPVDNDAAIPHMQYDFKPLADLDTFELNTQVDIKAVIYVVQDVFTFTARTSNREMTKRELGLWDPSGPSASSCVDMTLWGDAGLQNFVAGQVVFLKSASVREWNGARNVASPQGIDIDPDDKQAFELRAKYEENQRTRPLTITAKSGGGGSGQRKTLQGIKEEDVHLGMPPPPGQPADPSQPRWIHRHNATGIITSLPSDRLPCYMSCPELVDVTARSGASTQAPASSRPCQKKVSEEGPGSWRCAAGHLCRDPVYRYICRMQVMDHTEMLEINLFDEQAKKVFGCDAGEYAKAFEDGDQVEQINRRALFKRVSLRMRSAKEVWQEAERVRVSVEEINDLDYKKESRLMLTEIRSSLGAS